MTMDPMAKKENELLEFIKKAEREFDNHRLWQELQCTPEKFFRAVRHHIAGLNLSREEWHKAYNRAKQASRIRVLEKQQPQQNRMMGALRA